MSLFAEAVSVKQTKARFKKKATVKFKVRIQKLFLNRKYD